MSTGVVAGRRARRLATLLLLLAALALVVPSTPAGADPAGPTDYRTTITSIEPASDVIDVEVIGGDSFVQLTVDPGSVVTVIGYNGESYLRFLADGTVERNERSPARWANDDRYGLPELPAEADPDADPVWEVVATDGRYAWHDHRAHWMNPAKPPGAGPGDVILEAVVPLVVDGETVLVSVKSTLLEPPGFAAIGLGAVAGIVLLLVARAAFGELGLVGAGAVATLAALVAGFVAYTSVPPETGPTILLWGLPAVGVAALTAWVWVRSSALGKTSAATLLGPAFVTLAGVELLAWALLRREALSKALIPTDLPAGLDRGIVTMSLIVGFGFLGYGLRNLGGRRVT